MIVSVQLNQAFLEIKKKGAVTGSSIFYTEKKKVI